MIETKSMTVALIVTAMIMATAACAQVADSQQLQFATSPTSGRAPLPVSFSYPYASDNSTWAMIVDFGDGSSGGMQPPCANSPSELASCPGAGLWKGAHTYSVGTYTAILTRGGLPLCAICPAPVLGTVTITVTGGP